MNAVLSGALIAKQSSISECVKLHWHRVYGIAHQIVGNRDDALDVMQEVFLKLHKHWDRIDDYEKIPGWLSIVARTASYDLLRVRRGETITIQHGEEDITSYSANTHIGVSTRNHVDDVLLAETAQEIRQSINLIDSQYSAVIRKYYFENQKVAEIAASIGEPVGTIKWRLSRARELLKKEFIMSEIASNPIQSARFPRLHVNTIWGYSGPVRNLQPNHVSQSLLAQQILLTIHKQFRTAKEIGRAVSAETAYVEDHLLAMAEAEIVRREGKAYRANCILFNANDERKILEKRNRVGGLIAGIVANHLYEIDAVGREFSGSLLFNDKNQLRWIFVGIFLLNRGLGGKLAETDPGLAIHTPGRPDGGSWIFLPRLEKTAIPVEMGCNSENNGNPDNPIGISRYWNSDFRRQNTKQERSVMPIVERLSDGHASIASLQADVPEEDLAAAAELGYIDVKDGIATLAIPLFSSQDGDAIIKLVDTILGEMLEGVLSAYPEDVYQLFDSLGFSFIKEEYLVRSHNLSTLGTLRSLSEMGVLKVPSANRPVSWGVFAYTGNFTPMVWDS